MSYILEIATFNVQSALAAAHAGADRIEICDNMYEGGTTPSYGTLKLLKRKLDIPVFAMVRARGGDFLYTNEEFWVMKRDLKLFKELGCDGIVLGFLHADGTINTQQTAAFVEVAYPMEVTFHRAFDRAAQPFEALEDIIACGCQRILTSGQKSEAGSSPALIAQLVQQAGDRITIMPGSGVRTANIATIATFTGATELHSSARLQQVSAMCFVNAAMQEQLDMPFVDAAEINGMKNALIHLCK